MQLIGRYEYGIEPGSCLPISLFSPKGHVATRNPVFLENTTQGIKMYAVPDDDQSSMLIYETNISKK
ncbi:DUF6454 family protein [Bacillus gobiensis]|uniref:DUF6454 family protein n=1 Tax=Bacillus gobiensis TaxID=1441095 RepID=UPI003D21FFD8